MFLRPVRWKVENTWLIVLICDLYFYGVIKSMTARFGNSLVLITRIIPCGLLVDDMFLEPLLGSARSLLCIMYSFSQTYYNDIARV